MPRTKSGVTPAYCLHRQSGRAYVRLNRQQVMLGTFGSKESREAYHRVVAEWEANGRRSASQLVSQCYLVASLCEDYQAHSEVYYRHRDGTPTMEVRAIEVTTRRLRELYASLPAAEFGLRQLKTVRESLVNLGLSRGYVNDSIGRIVRMFRWGAEEERLPAETFGRLKALRRLQPFRSKAPEPTPREPVADGDVEAVLPFLGRHVRAMVIAMWRTAMRCGEVVQLRTRDVDMTGTTWVFQPVQHKTAHRGQSRLVDIGPEAIEALRPFVSLDPNALWFQPRDVTKEFQQMRRKGRKTPLWPSHLKAQTKRSTNPQRRPGSAYTTHVVGRAIRRACRRAGVKVWTPHQLRHAALTHIRKQKGGEASMAVGGHYSLRMADLYTKQAQRDLAARVIAQLG